MKQSEYLDATKAKLGLPSDYALAKHLELSKETISQLRSGKMHLSDKLARRFADILGIHPGFVLIDIQRERAKSDDLRGLWEEIYVGFHAPLRRARSVKGHRPHR